LDAYFIVLGSGCLVCLMPLALYLLYLAHLNGRTPPALVPGPWDFGAVLLGLSGFLILAGPLLLTLVSAVWRSYAFGGWADLKSVGAREAWAGSLMAVGYLILMGVGIFTLLRARRPVTPSITWSRTVWSPPWPACWMSWAIRGGGPTG